ncbi:hypothetical protein FG379_001617 [Cryptosporidium bovis]|uniref:uncharacterized protein n=1 Tax=Cryptosporidium bovis TaxID=310047 RepID=UPI00351AAC80|nr:hypothetical protein FG379_001617 [Cryptosporidium bovis]
MKRVKNNGDLSTSPGTTDESPNSLVMNNIEGVGCRYDAVTKINFWERYQKLSRMIENILIVLDEYEMDFNLKSEKEAELKNLSDKLEMLKLEWEEVDFKTAHKNNDEAISMINKAINSTEISISRVNSIENKIDFMLDESKSDNEESELCRDLELDVEYSLLKSSCDERIELMECYQRVIDELRDKYENLISKEYENGQVSHRYTTEISGSNIGNNDGFEEQDERPESNDRLYFDQEDENNNNDNYEKGDQQNDSKKKWAEYRISRINKNINIAKSILGGRRLCGESDYLLELLSTENDIQSDILRHISNVIGISPD